MAVKLTFGRTSDFSAATAIGVPLFDKDRFNTDIGTTPVGTDGLKGSLWIDDGDRSIPVIDYERLLELRGAQTITGQKTIDISLLLLPGGGAFPDGVLSTDGASTGGLFWQYPFSALVAATASLSEDVAQLRRDIEKKKAL
jgi:hypothetical protein